MPDACLVVGSGGEILRLNSLAEKLFGYEARELENQPLDRLIPARHRRSHSDHVASYETRPETRSMGSGFSLSAVRKDGVEIPVDVSLVPIETDEGLRILAAIRDISQSEERYRAIFEQVAVGVVHSDHDGRVLNVNPKFCEMSGYSRREARALRFPEAIHPDDRETSAEARARLLAGSISSHAQDARLICKDGTPFWVHVTVSLVRSASGQPLHFMSVIHDISAQKLAEEQRLETELRFRQVTENINEVFWLTDPAKNEMLYVSPAYETIWGRSLNALLSSPRDWMEAIHPEDRLRVMRAALTTQAGGTYDEVYRIVRPDGFIRWIRDRGFPVYAKNGRVERLAGVAEDVTWDKEAVDALKESERRFSHMLENVELIALMLDRDARITYCNDYLLRLTGWERREVQGRDWFENFVPPEIRGEMEGVFTSLVSDLPNAWHYENEIVTRSGERRLVRWNNSVLRSAAGDVIGTASIGEDITEQRQAEERIRRLNRVYAVLSGINALIVRARDREQLLREACRIAVEDGGFSVAWTGIVDPASKELRPVAWEGATDEFMVTLARALRESEPGSGLVGRAVREMKPAISNDLEHDPGISTRAEVLAMGSRVVVALPLIVGDEAVGVLELHAQEPEIVDEEEMRLLLELSGDISFALDHLEKADRVAYLAFHDSLTDLPNRDLFRERLEQSIGTAARAQGRVAVVAFDIERFRTVNATLGRQAGDELLSRIAALGRRHLPDDNTLARIGADQFAFLIPSARSSDAVVRRVGRRMQEILGAPFALGGTEVRVSARVGIAMYPDDGSEADALLRNAEAALRKAKTSGERQLFFAPEMTARAAERLALETRLRSALENGEFAVHYQTKMDLETRRIAGVEALLRWNSPEMGLVPAASFVPILEETGLILEVGSWTLSQAVQDHARWSERGVPAARVAVNISAFQLRQRGFVTVLRTALAQGVDPAGIDLEITESLVMENIEENIETLRSIRDLGVDIAIDDFGTGYSSLGYLARLPATSLKIDRAFIATMLDDPNAMTLVQTVISLAHSLRLKVVAEGVETEEQAKVLRLLRCDQIQGYLIGKPVSFDEMTELLQQHDTPAHRQG
jgi:PAS domain S-box-containing protein/diguanylate cyclase (GGDEF)-like protein